MTARAYFLHALTPLHAGTGQGVGLLDLPIAREVATNHPIVPGSSVKGVLRDVARQPDQEKGDSKRVNELFGKLNAATQEEVSASVLRFSDARLLLMPVRSDRGTFAWVTCPLVLERLQRDSQGTLPFPKVLPIVGSNSCTVTANSVLVSKEKAVLAELSLSAFPTFGPLADSLASWIFPNDPHWQALLKGRIALVSDDVFTWMAEHSTEVRAQIRLDPERGVVARGALWYTESLPAESVLVGICEAVGGKAADWKALEALTTEPFQVGGKATIGLGRVRMVIGGGK